MAERVRPINPEVVGLGERSTQEPEVVVHTHRISSPINRNITPTQTEHNAVTPERELEHAVKCRCNQHFTLDDIANTLQDVRKNINIGKHSPYKSSGFKAKHPFRVELKEKLRERVVEVAKKKNSCHNCFSTDHHANNCPKENKKVYAIEKVSEVESPTDNSESDSMDDAIREKSDDDQDPSKQILVEYQEETTL
ncbi:hypothetical protein O181_056075 [Austropuccinia psidii MF-1]|uniref:Uncharacterized protein n=1 Tax=Austropuccinia psidii MF-1 TaxID=1389203 RepID=A0A9Q3E5I4_9BASI|nr:hypothetical protein [Austropuccinia psidii MF-1]